jgi:hypothetical protein
MDDALKSLLIFSLILSLAGTVIAVAWYFGVEIPIRQVVLHAPMNTPVPR